MFLLVALDCDYSSIFCKSFSTKKRVFRSSCFSYMLTASARVSSISSFVQSGEMYFKFSKVSAILILKKEEHFVMMTSIVRLFSNRSYVRTNQNAIIIWVII